MANVLVLDGDEVSLACLQDILATFGHQVMAADSQESALAAAENQDFDLFLYDLRLDGIDAGALTKTFLSTSPKSTVVAITSYPKEPQALEALEAGTHSLMRKPYEIGRILHLLSEPRP